MKPGDVVTWTGPTAQGTVTVPLTLTHRCDCCGDWHATEPDGKETRVPENEIEAT